mmetsp:Transcript_141417/g.452028  ORF Transcript_141417/g.452028 Transcript_141417/m.452028 type:complete len:111 (+) Transcript_141417:1190-1522(+)
MGQRCTASALQTLPDATVVLSSLCTRPSSAPRLVVSTMHIRHQLIIAEPGDLLAKASLYARFPSIRSAVPGFQRALLTLHLRRPPWHPFHAMRASSLGMEEPALLDDLFS